MSKRMPRPRFSVITPVHLWNDDRVNWFLRAMESLKNQTFKDFEWVVIDDGSTLPFLWDKLLNSGINVRLIHSIHEERVISYNAAFAVAKGQWFALLDSDDEYKPNSLEKMDRMIKRYPTDVMFNFGALYNQKDGEVKYRDPFKPKRKKHGHESFGGGNIVNGTFIWNRIIWETIGAYPPTHIKDVDCTEINYPAGGEMVRDLYMGTPYDFSAAAQLEFPEIRKYFMVDHESEPAKILKELGNPWGQDYYLFYKYTRKYHSRPIKEYLYIVNPR